MYPKTSNGAHHHDIFSWYFETLVWFRYHWILYLKYSFPYMETTRFRFPYLPCRHDRSSQWFSSWRWVKFILNFLCVPSWFIHSCTFFLCTRATIHEFLADIIVFSKLLKLSPILSDFKKNIFQSWYSCISFICYSIIPLHLHPVFSSSWLIEYQDALFSYLAP